MFVSAACSAAIDAYPPQRDVIFEPHSLLPQAGPVWFTVLQAGLGLARFLIGLAMVAGYRRSGPWGAF